MTNKTTYTYLKIPTEKWDILMETLSLDARSSSFDESLRVEITEALETIEQADTPDGFKKGT